MQAIEKLIESDAALADTLALMLNEDAKHIIEQGTQEIKAGQLLINDRPLTHQPVPVSEMTPAMKVADSEPFGEIDGDRQYLILNNGAINFPKQQVPRGCYFVLGDNRPSSRDSREFGVVPHADIVGRVSFNYFPSGSWNRFGKFR